MHPVTDLVRQRFLRDTTIGVLDCGAKGGDEALKWAPLEDNLLLYGFDPDVDECERLNAQARMASRKHQYYPLWLTESDRCSFCCIQAPFRSGELTLGHKPTVNSYRRWGFHSALQQIDKVVTNYGVRNIKFADELFVLNRSHVMGICDGIIQRGYGLNIWAYARVDSVEPDMLDTLKQAGINWLALGIEAASDAVRNDVHEGVNQQKARDCAVSVRAAGIRVIGNYIFGLPEDDVASMQATLDLAMELNCEFANFYCAMAYPGSQLYQTALKQGFPLPASRSDYSQHAFDTLPLPTTHSSGSEVLRFRDRALHIYFNNPVNLDMVAGTFGEETANHVRQVASHSLTRKYA